MAGEDDAVHVVGFTLDPIGRIPQAVDTGKCWLGIVHMRVHFQAFTRLGVQQQVDHAKAIGGSFVFEQVDCRDVTSMSIPPWFLRISRTAKALLAGTTRRREPRTLPTSVQKRNA